MYTIDQEVANDIARTTPMKYPEMKALFQMTEEEADKWEMDFRDRIEEKTDFPTARGVLATLALYLESKAISNPFSIL